MAQTVLRRMAARQRREGRQEGTLEMARAAVKTVIRTRFPEAPASRIERVEPFQEPALPEELLGHLILAPSLEEVERLLAS